MTARLLRERRAQLRSGARPTTIGRRREGSLLAISDLHVTTPENCRVVEGLRPQSAADWLIVAGDVSEDVTDFAWTLDVLTQRFQPLYGFPAITSCGAPRQDQRHNLRGVGLYEHLVTICRMFGVITPEDPYPVWPGSGGPVRIVPLFPLYDYTFGSNSDPPQEAALARAWALGVVRSYEFLLHPDLYPRRTAWCEGRVSATECRLSACDLSLPTVLVNHFPLTGDFMTRLPRPEFARWCGTVRTADWHSRFNAEVVVYDHMHTPHTARRDGVRSGEVSLGYHREWHRRSDARPVVRRIPPVAER